MRVPRLAGVLVLCAVAGCTHQVARTDDRPKALDPSLVAAAVPLPPAGAPWTPLPPGPGSPDSTAAAPTVPDAGASASPGAEPNSPDPDRGEAGGASTRTAPGGGRTSDGGRDFVAPPARRDAGDRGPAHGDDSSPERAEPPRSREPGKTKERVRIPQPPPIDPKIICDFGEHVWEAGSPQEKTCRSVYG
ncbi:hypothetical protein [Embleya sp. NPDC050493]|uniref:hypothetical protein n=1 Tax=Embleya sp. NPDC050493 TaxID=3363989 RepID=UPI003794452B